MPDFERCIRSFKLYSSSEYEKPIVSAYYAGLDKAREEAVAMAAAFAIIIIVMALTGVI